MTNAMAQTIGAQAAAFRRQVISLSGDGGFSMLMGDFLQLPAQLGLPVEGVVVFNNSALVSPENRSLRAFLDFGMRSAIQTLPPVGFGVRGIRLEDPANVDEGVAAALAHDGPVLIDAVVSRMVLPIPPAITAEMAKGFTLYMVKAVFDGRKRAPPLFFCRGCSMRSRFRSTSSSHHSDDSASRHGSTILEALYLATGRPCVPGGVRILAENTSAWRSVSAWCRGS